MIGALWKNEVEMDGGEDALAAKRIKKGAKIHDWGVVGRWGGDGCG